jgi:hypothetical protein
MNKNIHPPSKRSRIYAERKGIVIRFGVMTTTWPWAKVGHVMGITGLSVGLHFFSKTCSPRFC